MNPETVVKPDEHATEAAHWLLKIIDNGLNALGLEHYKSAEEVIYLAIVIACAFAIAWLVKSVIYFLLRKLVQMRDSEMGKELLQMRTLSKCCQIIPPLVLMAMAPFALEGSHRTLVVIERAAGFYGLIMLAVALGSIMDFAFFHYNTHKNTRKLPLKGMLNVCKGITWIVIGICAVALVVDKSPAMLLTGLGAFAAALMLVFKDSILGFTAGIQMSENDMLHVGDWVVVPGTPANGVVMDVTLTTVKVQNFDNTIVTVPPYTMVSTSFQNYRGMVESGCRRMVKTLIIDWTSVVPVDDAQVDSITEKFPVLKNFVDNLRKAGKTEQNDGGLTPINGTIETNLGLFRAYTCYYIYNNPYINNTQQILIRLLEPTANGLPLEIYCFTATTDWDKYEAIQSAILEHLTTICSQFGLSIYSSSSLTIENADEKTEKDEVPSSAQDGGTATR